MPQTDSQANDVNGCEPLLEAIFLDKTSPMILRASCAMLYMFNKHGLDSCNKTKCTDMLAKIFQDHRDKPPFVHVIATIGIHIKLNTEEPLKTDDLYVWGCLSGEQKRIMREVEMELLKKYWRYL